MVFENRESLDPFGIASGFAPGAELNPTTPSAAESSALAQLLRMRDSAQQYIGNRQSMAQFNRLWLRGAQYLFYDRLRNDVVRQVSRKDMKSLPSIDNKLRPSHRALVGKMFSELGHLEAVPRSTDRSDVRAASIIDSYLDYFDIQTKSALKAIRALSNVSTDGTSFIELEWDLYSGQLAATCPDCQYVGKEQDIGKQCPTCMQEELLSSMRMMQTGKAIGRLNSTLQQKAAITGEPAPMMPAPPQELVEPQLDKVPLLKPVRFGQPIIRVHRFEDVLLDPGADEIDEVQWFIIAKPVPVNVARKRFPMMWQHINPSPHLIRDRYLDTTADEPEMVEVKLDNHTVVYKYMEAPSGAFPNGRIIHFTDNRVLEIRENFYWKMFNRMPLFVFRGDRNEGELFGQPWLDDAWHIQRERNELLSQMREYRRVTNAPKIIVEQGSGITNETIKQGHQILSVDRRTRILPTPIKPPEMPSYVQLEPNRMAEAIREKAGVTPHELGETKSKESGRYAALLEAQSTESLASTMFENREEWRDLHRCAVVMAQELMDPDQMWAITGSGKIKSYTWRDANVMPGWDIRIVHNSGYSRNPVVRRQQALEDLQVGLYTDKRTGAPDMAKYAKAAGIDSMMYANSTDDSERYYAREMVEIIKSGGMPVPQLWDNAEIIYSELTDYLRTEGRSDPPDVVAKVSMLWMQYLQAVMSANKPPNPDIIMSQMPYSTLGAPAMQGAMTQPVGAAGMGAGPMAGGGSMKPGAANVKGADQSAEVSARGGAKQETGNKGMM